MRAIWAGALLVVYLAATGALLVANYARVTPTVVALHFALLAFVAGSTWLGRAPEWLRMWTPLAVLFFLYAELPSLIRAAGHERLFDDAVMRWEYTIFGAQPAVVWAAQWPSRIVSELLHASYLSYYGIIVAVPLALYASGRRADFAEAVFVLMLTFTICFVFYLVFPVAGPRYLWPSTIAATAGPFRRGAVWLLEARSSKGTAFPSSHVAVAVTQSILALRYFGGLGFAIVVPSIGLAVGAVYGGFHYAVDVLAGGALGALGAVVALAGLGAANRLSVSRRQANASAPTYP